MFELCENLLNALVIALAVGTIFEVWRQRQSLLADELNDDLKALVWRVVIFLVFPFIVWLDLRSTLVATEYLGGWVKEWKYGMLWYYAVPGSLPHADLLVPALFAGVLVQFVLALCLLPSLFFRPHPFLAGILTCTITLILASNLIIDPIIGFAGAGSSRWQIAYQRAPQDSVIFILSIYACLSAIFLLAVRSRRIRLWFADLNSPILAEQLRISMSEAHSDRLNQYQSCRLALLFERAGMRSNAAGELSHLRKIAAGSIYVPFVEGYIQYSRRRFGKARASFEQAADFPALPDSLRSAFFSAAACAAYAQGETDSSINLAERALEFDQNSMVARMVKVDAYLRLGKREQAGEEVLDAFREGLDFNMEGVLPLDPETTLRQIFRYQKSLSQPVEKTDRVPLGR